MKTGSLVAYTIATIFQISKDMTVDEISLYRSEFYFKRFNESRVDNKIVGVCGEIYTVQSEHNSLALNPLH